VEVCIETAKGHHAKMLKECAQRECKESVYAKAEPELDYCYSLDDEVEKAKCIEKVEQWIADMLQECYPEQTCDEKAQDHLVEALEGCYRNTDPVEIDICVANVKDHVAKRLEKCELDECKEGVYADAEPRFDECNSLNDEDYAGCIEEV
jgi:hypothetical protein